MSIKDSPRPPLPTLAERRRHHVENATRNLISTVQNTHDTAEKQCPENSATRHSTLRQAVSTALSKTLSCTPNREQRTLLDNQDHHDLLDTIARRSCDLAVSAADYTFDAAITVNILTRIHSSSQGLNWQDHQQEAPPSTGQHHTYRNTGGHPDRQEDHERRTRRQHRNPQGCIHNHKSSLFRIPRNP